LDAAGGDRGWLRHAQSELEQGFGNAVGVVAQDAAFQDEVAGDGLDAEGPDAVEVRLDGRLAFARVLLEQRG
jgi:hypothetical protein